MSEVIPGMWESDPELIKLFAGTALTGKPQRFEMYISSLDDWYSISLFSPRQEYFVTVFDVITKRKQAEEERQKFVMLADSSSEFIGMCDLDLKPLYVNSAGMRMVGLLDLATACQVKVQDYFFPEDQRFITEEFYPRVLRDGHGDVEIRLRHFQSGEPIWMFYYLFTVRDTSGEIVGWATVSRDITERKCAEEAILKLNEDLEQKIDERTAELKKTITQLEELNRVFVDRELRMVELKERIAELEKK
jgi:PAS domain S-box-containing protein